MHVTEFKVTGKKSVKYINDLQIISNEIIFNISLCFPFFIRTSYMSYLLRKNRNVKHG